VDYAPSPDARPLVADIRAANEAFAAAHFTGMRPLAPARHMAIVACMDSRLDVFDALGLDNGDAHVIRNAGGVVTDDVIRSLMLSQRLMGTTSIVLVHHTDCGMQKVSEDQMKQEVEAETGMRPAFAIESFTDPYANVRQSISRLRHSPFLLHKELIVGFVYDVETGLLNQAV
jgi:carbonic anhydrase